ncbi:hypothetical protein M419DRAFT_118000, partial [Trichoderma reesei RUT C-30]
PPGKLLDYRARAHCSPASFFTSIASLQYLQHINQSRRQRTGSPTSAKQVRRCLLDRRPHRRLDYAQQALARDMVAS